MQFSKLGLAEPLLRATQALDYETATPIQSAAIPVVLSGVDLIGCAQTGTGKTAAFTLPMLHRLQESAGKRSDAPPSPARRRKRSRSEFRALRALVLSPTRELAAQIDDSLRRYGRFTQIRSAVVFGGVNQHRQVQALRRGVDVLVATPGRLLDLMNQGHISLSSIEMLVFDEADRMLDMGFLPDLRRIVSRVPAKRQTLMFSATMPSAIRSLAQQWLIRPVSVDLTPDSKPEKLISQSVHFVDKKRKQDLLAHYLQSTQRHRTLVFSRTKHGADKIVKRLVRDGVDAAAIHGNKSQNARSRALARFKGHRPPVLVATDIAARGLDIQEVSHVVNFDLPEAPETYVHRIGRTGRAGASGIAVSFCSADEAGLLRQIERLTRAKICVEPAVDGFEATEKQAEGRSSASGRRAGSRGNRGGGGRRAGPSTNKKRKAGARPTKPSKRRVRRVAG